MKWSDVLVSILIVVLSFLAIFRPIQLTMDEQVNRLNAQYQDLETLRRVTKQSPKTIKRTCSDYSSVLSFLSSQVSASFFLIQEILIEYNDSTYQLHIQYE